MYKSNLIGGRFCNFGECHDGLQGKGDLDPDLRSVFGFGFSDDSVEEVKGLGGAVHLAQHVNKKTGRRESKI